ncbi:MAG: hypothetical protein WBG19_07480 [Thermoplasmata archaeon]
MSIFRVAQWSLKYEHAREHDDDVLAKLLQHVREGHPSVLSARTWAVRFGSQPPTPGRIWMEEFESLASMESADKKEFTPECTQIWDRVRSMSVPGTYSTAIWLDNHRKLWK